MNSHNNHATQNIAIIGDGSMATVLALLLESAGHSVVIWGYNPKNVHSLIQTRENKKYLPGYRIPDTIRLTAEDDKIFKDATIILSAVPTQFIREIWTRLAPHVPANVPIASVAKGVEIRPHLGLLRSSPMSSTKPPMTPTKPPDPSPPFQAPQSLMNLQSVYLQRFARHQMTLNLLNSSKKRSPRIGFASTLTPIC